MSNAENEQLDSQQEFAKAANPLIEYLKANYNPHTTVIVTSTMAELMEGLATHHVPGFQPAESLTEEV